ncbi:hypothetical protein [Leucobacter sp. M11]|uniref:hypothetical protein n=1 Tax=Leucobacter sp. M11 TaxID=2993565 RepID=UPI002D8094E2|nr:hypothetical protein [Leucobacter sp. M11]MEB4615728.1 hypothetical protein [Leucobacter sp. M11]
MTDPAVSPSARAPSGHVRKTIAAALSTGLAAGLGFGVGSALSEDGLWWRSPPAERVIASLAADATGDSAPEIPALTGANRDEVMPKPGTALALGRMFQSSAWAFVDEDGRICLRLITPEETAQRCAPPREVARAGLSTSVGTGRAGLAALLLPDGLDLRAPPTDVTRVGEQAFLTPARVDGSPVPVSFPKRGGGTLKVPRLPSAAHTGGIDV